MLTYFWQLWYSYHKQCVSLKWLQSWSKRVRDHIIIFLKLKLKQKLLILIPNENEPRNRLSAA